MSVKNPAARQLSSVGNAGSASSVSSHSVANYRVANHRATLFATVISFVLSALIVVGALTSPSKAMAAGGDLVDPNLAQVIPANQPIVHGNHVISTGHVDMGPRFDNGKWRFLIADDAHKADANAVSVWRYPAETVLQVADQAQLKIPDDKNYSFIGAQPGSTAWVIPETQNPNVVWAGWNTQDPTVMAKLDRGATLTVSGIQGPGNLVVYLQSGSFGQPQVLWDSRKNAQQPIWVDTNTHTHANWVFTKAGVYMMRITAAANLKDGTKVSDTEYIRFAVGSQTSTDSAFSAKWTGPAMPTAKSGAAGASNSSSDAAGNNNAAAKQSSLVPILIWVLVGLAVVMAIGFTFAIISSNRTRRKVMEAVDASKAAKATPWLDGAAGEAGADSAAGEAGAKGSNSAHGDDANAHSADAKGQGTAQ